ncbi:MAG: hypothetical protein QXX94_00470 [Candidatus Bathyarchaeia archaeon]
MYKCAICDENLLEFGEGEFKRYYCSECDVSYYVYSPEVEVHRQNLTEIKGMLEDDNEERGRFLNLLIIVLQFILVGILELIYQIFFL